jgi:hypothetical protein
MAHLARTATFDILVSQRARNGAAVPPRGRGRTDDSHLRHGHTMTACLTGDWTVSHDFAYVPDGAERVTRLLAKKVLEGAPVLALLGSPSILDELSGPGGRFVFNRLMGRTADTHRTLIPAYPAALRVRR